MSSSFSAELAHELRRGGRPEYRSSAGVCRGARGQRTVLADDGSVGPAHGGLVLEREDAFGRRFIGDDACENLSNSCRKDRLNFGLADRYSHH